MVPTNKQRMEAAVRQSMHAIPGSVVDASTVRRSNVSTVTSVLTAVTVLADGVASSDDGWSEWRKLQ